MKRIPIKDGLSFSSIALGDSKRGKPEFEEAAFAVMDRYLELGGDTFDSARLYDDGGADRALMKWMRSRGIERDSIHIVTKGSHPDKGNMFVSRLSKAKIEQDINESLSFMGIDCSDIHFLHRDDVEKPVEEIMPVLDGLVKAGKTRAVGVSNWTVSRIIEANLFALENGLEPIRCCQMHFSLAQSTAHMMKDLTFVPMNDVEFTWYRESQLPLMCFGAQARGWFVTRSCGKEPSPSAKRHYDLLPENHRRLIRLEKLSESIGKSFSAITTAYVRDRGLNAVVLSSFSSVAQLEEAFEANSLRLTNAQIQYLETGVGTC